MRLALLAVLIAALAGCPHPLPGPGPDADAAATRGTCATACAHLRALGCPAGSPSPGGVSCEAVCTNIQAEGAFSWSLACRSRAKTCAAVDACER